MRRSIEKLRVEYGNDELLEGTLHPNPIDQFLIWFEKAIEAQLFEPNGMTLATVSTSGRPSSRTVLLKKVDREGFVFFTDYQSRKAQQLAQIPFAALNFWWREIFRQVCIEGVIEKISRQEVRKYFEKRPRGAQIAVHASVQSSPLASRMEIEEAFDRLTKKYRGKRIPCPVHWGGYRLIPERFEFWQGRANRLHDRFVYIKAEGDWIFTRLSP